MAEPVPGRDAVEALLLTSPEPLDVETIAERVPEGTDVEAALASLSEEYAGRSLRVVRMGGGWTVRTDPELSGLCRRMLPAPMRLSKAALETLAAIALFQPVTRPELERVRGVTLAKGTLDALVWSGLVRPAGRRASPGNPLEFAVTPLFLTRYGLPDMEAVPGREKLAAEGLDGPEPEGDFIPPAQSGEDAL